MHDNLLRTAVVVWLYALPLPLMAAGDAARGEQIHQSCLSCHGTELYVPPRAKVKSLSALGREVQKWNDRYNPKFSKQEVDDLVAYLNRDFYRFR